MSTHDPHPSPSPSPSLMVCIDLETTGLDEQTGLVLEVAARVVTNDLSLVVAQRSPQGSIFPVIPWRGRMNDFVVNMHTKIGLIADVDRVSLTVADVDACVAAYLGSHADGVPLLLVGNSITLDRNFLPSTSR